DVLPLPFEVDGNGRRVGRSPATAESPSAAESAAATTTRTTTTLPFPFPSTPGLLATFRWRRSFGSFPFGTTRRFGRQLGLPDRLTGILAERHHERLRPPRCADEFLAVHQWRFAVAPRGNNSAEVLGQTPLPNDLPPFGFETSDPASHADHVQPIAINSRSAAGSLLPLRHPLLHCVPKRRPPELCAVST